MPAKKQATEKQFVNIQEMNSSPKYMEFEQFDESVYNYIHSRINGPYTCKQLYNSKISQVGFGMHCWYIFVADLLSWIYSTSDKGKTNLYSSFLFQDDEVS